jgi:hypothetical protein
MGEDEAFSRDMASSIAILRRLDVEAYCDLGYPE